jgi:hypothetical protein
MVQMELTVAMGLMAHKVQGVQKAHKVQKALMVQKAHKVQKALMVQKAHKVQKVHKVLVGTTV